MGLKCPVNIYSVLNFCSFSHCCLWLEAPDTARGKAAHGKTWQRWHIESWLLQIWKGKYLAPQECDTWMQIYWQTTFTFIHTRYILLIGYQLIQRPLPEVPLSLVLYFRALDLRNMVVLSLWTAGGGKRPRSFSCFALHVHGGVLSVFVERKMSLSPIAFQNIL